MLRIVFFGLDGAFATVALNALAHAGLRPSLVVRGLPKDPRPWRPVVHRIPAQPTWWHRLAGGKVPPETSPNNLASTAHRLGIDAIETSNANQSDVLRLVARPRPDVFVVAGFEPP
ncbi:MAG: hypothetical protein AAF449_12595, partial [Myxococcota bacterium]